ncbi:hypothetical protein J6590_006405, partial [Homalodisca vitripennis]
VQHRYPTGPCASVMCESDPRTCELCSGLASCAVTTPALDSKQPFDCVFHPLLLIKRKPVWFLLWLCQVGRLVSLKSCNVSGLTPSGDLTPEGCPGVLYLDHFSFHSTPIT